jgi:CubicO group peptidase (beta-lactamase class C family)
MRRLLLLACVLALAADKNPLPPDPARLKARAFAEATLGFDRYVFAGESFPAERLRHAPVLAEALGPGTTWSAAFFGRDLRTAAAPDHPGPYAARVRIRPKEGPALLRFVTLFRVRHPVPDGTKFGPTQLPAFARAVGVDPDVVARNATAVLKSLGGSTFGEWSRLPESARLLAGLALSRPGKGPVHSYDDAQAMERQWWVDLKRRRVYPPQAALRPFVCPTRAAKPAPVVRAGSEEEAGVKKGSAAKIDAALQALAKDSTEAFAVCIVHKGVIVLHKAYGTRDGKPMTVDTPSWMASITKTMTASLMLMLIDQGLVGLDDPIDKYLPAFRGIQVKKPLTIHHLFTHTNGLTIDGWPGWGDDVTDLPERVSAYYDKLRVGQEWAYTGTGNMLGGKVIEAVTGEALPQAFHKHLFGPLGCTHTYVADSHAGSFSTPLDVATFAQMLLNRGAYGPWRFFREETFDHMLPRRLEKLLGPGTKKTFGFGLDGGVTKFGHGAASGATFHIDAGRQLVVVMTRNKWVKEQDKHGGAVWKAIDEAVVKP